MARVRRLQCSPARLRRAVAASAREAGKPMLRGLRQAIPSLTGRTRRSTRSRVVRTGRGIRWQARILRFVGAFLTKGTKAHTVRPRRKRALTIPTGDGVLVRGRAEIPAQPPRVDPSAVERQYRTSFKRRVAKDIAAEIARCFRERR